MVKLFLETQKLRENLYEVLKVYAPKLKMRGCTSEHMILEAYKEHVGWVGRLKPSFKMKYNLVLAAITYWCRHNPHRNLRRWCTDGVYPAELSIDYKLRQSKAQDFLNMYREEVLYPYKTVLGVFNDKFMRDLYDCLYKMGCIRSTVVNVYKSIRW